MSNVNISDYKEGVLKHPCDSNKYVQLANAYITNLHLPHMAIKYYKKAIHMNDQKQSYYIGLEKAEKEINNIPECINDIEHAIALKPDSSSLYNELGLLYLHRGHRKNIELASKYFKSAIHYNPGCRKYCYNEGVSELLLKNYKASLKYIQKAIDDYGWIKPNYFKYISKCVGLYNNRGLKYGVHNNDAEASKCYKAAISISFSPDAVLYYNLARAYEALKHVHKAVDTAKLGIKKDSRKHDKGKSSCRKLIERLTSSNAGSHSMMYDSNTDYSKKLNSLIGLGSVKYLIHRYLYRSIIHKIRQGKAGHGEIHLILEGNPGTGKTTVAKLLCGILYQKHIVSKPNFVIVNSTQLIYRHYGESAEHVRKVINKAMGGVLFIDEAYHLMHKSNGNSACQDEAITELLPDIEKYRNNIVVIMAGYTHAMEKFLNRSNPGLGSRFPNRIKFPDYTNRECIKIMKLDLDKNHFKISSNKAKDQLDSTLADYLTADRSNMYHVFSNARTVRNLYERLTDAFAARLMNNYTQSQLCSFKRRKFPIMNTIKSVDIKNGFGKYILGKSNKSAIRKLNSLIGLNNVKSLITSSVNQVTMNKIRDGRNYHDPMHLVFEGNPGTGKTTVAKLFCKILYQKGITKSANCVYVSAPRLQSKWFGQGAKNMRKAVRKSLNGVLFIDEAYALGDPNNKAIVDQLISDISKYRNKLVIILAGYPKAMENFLNGANSGLSSRFPDRIKFPDYTDHECLEILKYDLKNHHLRTASKRTARLLSKVLIDYVSSMRHAKGHDFANARTVNNLFKYLVRNLNDRLCQNSVSKLKRWRKTGSNKLNTVTDSDIRKTNEQMKRLTKLQTVSADNYSHTDIGFGVPNIRKSKNIDI